MGKINSCKKVDTAQNDVCRIVTGCLKNTPVEKVYILAGIAPPSIRRLISTNLERQKLVNDLRHLMYGQMATVSQIKIEEKFS